MKTQVGIIGSGPAGLLLAQILAQNNIDTVILERQTKEHVLSRIRAGVLETIMVDALNRANAAKNLNKNGIIHEGCKIIFNNKETRIDFKKSTNKHIVVYGQTEVTQDLMSEREAMGGITIYQADNVSLNDVDSKSPYIKYDKNGVIHRLDCDFIVGCDGYHGISRKTIPSNIKKEYETVYPFGWLGLLTDAPPISEELIYGKHSRGFYLCSQRSKTRSRYYLQVPLDEKIEEWSDDRFWDELSLRLSPKDRKHLVRSKSLEKSIAPLRSFVSEPMRYGNLFLAGDAAHIVPPTGAKGLNLAASDVMFLADGFESYYLNHSHVGLEAYSSRCLERIWGAERFSWYMTKMLHTFDSISDWDKKMQLAEFNQLLNTDYGAQLLAENYVGLDYSSSFS